MIVISKDTTSKVQSCKYSHVSTYLASICKVNCWDCSLLITKLLSSVVKFATLTLLRLRGESGVADCMVLDMPGLSAPS